MTKSQAQFTATCETAQLILSEREEARRRAEQDPANASSYCLGHYFLSKLLYKHSRTCEQCTADAMGGSLAA